MKIIKLRLINRLLLVFGVGMSVLGCQPGSPYDQCEVAIHCYKHIDVTVGQKEYIGPYCPTAPKPCQCFNDPEEEGEQYSLLTTFHSDEFSCNEEPYTGIEEPYKMSFPDKRELASNTSILLEDKTKDNTSFLIYYDNSPQGLDARIRPLYVSFNINEFQSSSYDYVIKFTYNGSVIDEEVISSSYDNPNLRYFIGPTYCAEGQPCKVSGTVKMDISRANNPGNYSAAEVAIYKRNKLTLVEDHEPLIKEYPVFKTAAMNYNISTREINIKVLRTGHKDVIDYKTTSGLDIYQAFEQTFGEGTSNIIPYIDGVTIAGWEESIVYQKDNLDLLILDNNLLQDNFGKAEDFLHRNAYANVLAP